MKRLIMLFAVVGGIFIMFGIAFYFPVRSLPVNSDFSAIYNTDLALVHGVPIYDLVAVRALVMPLSGVPDEAFFLARFPYPAWYALSTFYLGLLTAHAAATLWFEMNLVMLFLSVWLMTDGWPGRLRLALFPAALLFLPVLGALIVGQYDFPVLLGAALALYALKREDTTLVVCGALLLTFKPHIGVLIFIFLLIWLLLKGDDFGRRALKYIALVLFSLIVLGFLADLHWISRYVHMLLSYQNEGNVTACSECISLPILISRWFFDGSLRTAILIGAAVLALLSVSYYFNRPLFLKSPAIFLTAALFTTLLASPYFYNYDFILLLIPFALLVGEAKSWLTSVLLGLCYLTPYIAISWYGRDGNAFFIVITLVLFGVFYLWLKNTSVAASSL